MKYTPLLHSAGMALLVAGCAAGEWTAGRPIAGARTAGTAAVSPPAAGRPVPEAWEQAGQRALRSGLMVPAPFHERIRYPEHEAHAVAYRVHLVRGATVAVAVEAVTGDAAPRIDLFEMITPTMFRQVGQTTGARREVRYTATWTGTHVVRLQPEPGAGGTFDVSISAGDGLLFPVAGAGPDAVRSVFGDPRDGGARGHEGIDIFAPRGTPALAVADGAVTAVESTAIGGRVVWIADAVRDVSYYYAHLDEQRVRRGDFVRAGDVVGTVGNSGNARGTSPHLHFGVYVDRHLALDPAPLLSTSTRLVDARAADLPATDPALGRWVRLAGDRVRLRGMPSTAGAIVAELRAGTPLLVLGVSAGWRRVVLEDGTAGFIAAGFTGRAISGSERPD